MIKLVLKDLQENIFPSGLKTRETIQDELPKHLHPFVNFRILEDKIIYRGITRQKNYESLMISKYLQSESDILQCLEYIMEAIESNILIYVDFDCLYETADKTRPYKFEYGSKASKVNSIFKIVSKTSVEEFLKEFDISRNELIAKQFENHSKIMQFQSSGFRPMMILSMKIFIQSMSH